MLYSGHESGVPLVSGLVGAVLYSHAAAIAGRLVRLHVDEVGHTRTTYHTDEDTEGLVGGGTGSQPEPCRNWEIIDFSTAAAEIRAYWSLVVFQAEAALTKARTDRATALAQLPEPEAQAQPTTS